MTVQRSLRSPLPLHFNHPEPPLQCDDVIQRERPTMEIRVYLNTGEILDFVQNDP